MFTASSVLYLLFCRAFLCGLIWEMININAKRSQLFWFWGVKSQKLKKNSCIKYDLLGFKGISTTHVQSRPSSTHSHRKNISVTPQMMASAPHHTFVEPKVWNYRPCQ